MRRLRQQYRRVDHHQQVQRCEQQLTNSLFGMEVASLEFPYGLGGFLQ